MKDMPDPPPNSASVPVGDETPALNSSPSTSQQDSQLLSQVFFSLFKVSLSSQLEEKGKQLEESAKIDKEAST